jgi:hypothetical protein
MGLSSRPNAAPTAAGSWMRVTTRRAVMKSAVCWHGGPPASDRPSVRSVRRELAALTASGAYLTRGT